jgi:hypothetical protein
MNLVTFATHEELEAAKKSGTPCRIVLWGKFWQAYRLDGVTYFKGKASPLKSIPQV